MPDADTFDPTVEPYAWWPTRAIESAAVERSRLADAIARATAELAAGDGDDPVDLLQGLASRAMADGRTYDSGLLAGIAVRLVEAREILAGAADGGPGDDR